MVLYKDTSTGQVRMRGSFGSLIVRITEMLNMTYEVKSPIDGKFGTPISDPNEFNGQLAMVSPAISYIWESTKLFETIFFRY